MTLKLPIYPDRIRSVPKQFNWVDHRLIRDHHIEHLSHEACTLYLFLVTVADCQGLSYYSDSSICERIGMGAQTLCTARACLRKAELIAWKKPLYQLLPLVDLMTTSQNNRESLVRDAGTTTSSDATSISLIPEKLCGGIA